jgi:tetratricopeptide (TPR) repeat protein
MTFKLSGRPNEAGRDLLDAMRHGGDVSLLAAALGEVYASQGNLAGAAQIFRKTFNETGAPEFQVAYALALEKQGNVTEALKEMEKAAALLPNDARTHFEYGKLLSENGRINEAKRELERAKALDPKLPENLYALSRLYQKLGETDRATNAMKEFLASKQKSGASPQ